jgi:hypothetical protein
VQRFIMPAGRSTTWAARRYFEWLPTAFFGVIRVHHVEPEDRYDFRLVGSKRNLLSLRIDHQSSRQNGWPTRLCRVSLRLNGSTECRPHDLGVTVARGLQQGGK